MAPSRKNSRNHAKKEVKPAEASRNGRKAEAGGGVGAPRNSIFTWFMVLALLGVWSSVAVVWFDLVDYDDVIGRLGAYDADGDGDFDVEDAKVLLGLTKDGANENAESLEEVLDILAEEGSDWFHGFFTFLYDVVTTVEKEVEEEEEGQTAEEEEAAGDERAIQSPALQRESLKKEDKTDVKKKAKVSKEAVEAPVSKAEKPKEDKPEDAKKKVKIEDDKSADVAPRKNKSKGLKERPVVVVQREAVQDQPIEEQDSAPQPGNDDDVVGSQNTDVESEIQAAVPLPEPSDNSFVPDDDRSDDPLDAHPYEAESDAIDTQGELVQEASHQETAEESEQYKEQSRSQDTEAESVTEPETEVEHERQSTTDRKSEAVTEPQAESEPGHGADQPDDKLKDKGKKKKPKLLNKFDKTIKTEIDAAEKLRKKGKIEEALRAFESLVQQYPHSPRCRYGKAQAQDDQAEKQRSNEGLLTAINTYREAAELPDATPDLIKTTMKRRAERQQFLGRMRGAVATLEKLLQIFPEDVSLKNDLGVAHLLIGDNKSAKRVYEEVLAVAPNDGFAKVHYGFILKSENQIEESIPYLREGLESGDPGTDDGRFYFHLGDALQRIGDDSAYHWYEIGHQRGHFASVWQRSLYNVDGLKAQPWWSPQDTGYTELVKSLEKNWRSIRDEALSVMDRTTGLFVPEEENLREKGEWGQFTLWQQGRKAGDACRSVPKTCALLERYPEAIGCKRGQIKFSVMQPGTHVWPHTGPTNCRLRMHLGLVIPKQGCKIRCTNDTRAWEEGKVLIFDDSFEHEVWQDADSYRLIFIVDVWHPELTQYQHQTLSPI